MTETAEIRLEIPRQEVAVLDGYCAATGRSRTDVLREVLGAWSKDKHTEAIYICRVAGCNPDDPAENRKAAK